MNGLTQGRSRLYASFAKSPLVCHQNANNMNELTQARSRIHETLQRVL